MSSKMGTGSPLRNSEGKRGLHLLATDTQPKSCTREMWRTSQRSSLHIWRPWRPFLEVSSRKWAQLQFGKWTSPGLDGLWCADSSSMVNWPRPLQISQRNACTNTECVSLSQPEFISFAAQMGWRRILHFKNSTTGLSFWTEHLRDTHVLSLTSGLSKLPLASEGSSSGNDSKARKGLQWRWIGSTLITSWRRLHLDGTEEGCASFESLRQGHWKGLMEALSSASSSCVQLPLGQCLSWYRVLHVTSVWPGIGCSMWPVFDLV